MSCLLQSHSRTRKIPARPNRPQRRSPTVDKSAGKQVPRILVMEDEPLIALGLKLVLENMGCAVPAIVDNAKDAVSAAESDDFDLVLADVRLKGGDDGVVAVERIRMRHAVPVLYVTGNAAELERRGLGQEHILRKPFLPTALERAVRGLLNGVQARR